MRLPNDNERDPIGLGTPGLRRIPQRVDLMRQYVRHLERMLQDARADLAESEGVERAGIN